MRRISKKEIKAQVEALKGESAKPIIRGEQNMSKLSPKKSSQRIRKQGI